jgi:hypothetical protein
MICASVCLLLGIFLSPFLRPKSYTVLDEPRGAGQIEISVGMNVLLAITARVIFPFAEI